MAMVFNKTLLRHAFTKTELEFLLQNDEFTQRRDQVQTMAEFERLCVLGFELLEKRKKLRIASRATKR